MIKHKENIILSLSNINADFLQLILCMFVSHIILDNPLYGAALYLFVNIWILYFQGGLYNIKGRYKGKTSIFMWLMLAASVFAGLVIVFLYPLFMNKPESNYVSFFVLMVGARALLTHKISTAFNQKKRAHYFYKILFQLLFLIPCLIFAHLLFSGMNYYIIVVGFFYTGIQLTFQSDVITKLRTYNEKFKDSANDIYSISSYLMFSRMTLFSQIAFSLGVLMYICFISFTQPSLGTVTYLIMALWLTGVLIIMEIFSRYVNKKRWMLSINLFIIGATCWIVGSIKMYDASGILSITLWTCLWGFGLACITSVMNRLNGDFKLITDIANKKISEKELNYRKLLLQIIAMIIANAIVLCILTFWNFVIPEFSETELPATFRRLMVQLPAVFMIISMFYALKQPLDDRNRQKLMNYYAGTNQNLPTQQNLVDRLVNKYRVRFGIKIIATIVRPFLHLRVSGKSYMDTANYPSVFICNHGILYGPVAAVIYLPTYFRPWIDRKMVDRNLSADEMYNRFMYNVPLLSEKAKRWFTYQLAGPVTWALNSFNPIAVERDNLRNVMSTFHTTVNVLKEGDNVLIFPERPHKVKLGKKETVMHETETVGTLFTGFASIGKMYYEETGKQLRFYPIYANKKGHTFRIGEPVIYNPENPAKEEKERIAQSLQSKMLELKNIPRKK